MLSKNKSIQADFLEWIYFYNIFMGVYLTLQTDEIHGIELQKECYM